MRINAALLFYIIVFITLLAIIISCFGCAAKTATATVNAESYLEEKREWNQDRIMIHSADSLVEYYAAEGSGFASSPSAAPARKRVIYGMKAIGQTHELAKEERRGQDIVAAAEQSAAMPVPAAFADSAGKAGSSVLTMIAICGVIAIPIMYGIYRIKKAGLGEGRV
jgi:hypothetical protein